MIIRRTRSRGPAFLLALAALATIAVIPGASQAGHCDGLVEPKIVQPLEGSTLQVARVAGDRAGAPDYWEMKIDAFHCTAVGDHGIDATQVTVEHLIGGVTVKVQQLPAVYWLEHVGEQTPAPIQGNGHNQLVFYRDKTLRNAFPLPQQVRLTFEFNLGSRGLYTVARTYGIAEHRNPGPLGSYFFPFQQADLPAAHYWTQYRHNELSTHQRWAYDFLLKRWDPTTNSWTHLRKGATSQAVANDLSFDQPVYAMSDGEIIGCNRGAPDNEMDQTVGNVRGGNLLWIRSGGETTLYAHFKQNSIPYALCPFSDDAEHTLANPFKDTVLDIPYKVRAGQYLGQTGSSGSSQSGPHLHVHAFKGLPAIWGGSERGIDSDARPMRFVNARAQLIKADADVDEILWNDMSNAVAPYNSRVLPNQCMYVPAELASLTQSVNYAVTPECFSQMYNAHVQAGMRPVHVDFGDDTVINSIWRRDDGTPWAFFYHLDTTQLQGVHNEWFLAKGYRYAQVEAYELDGVLRHAALLIKQPGGAQWLDPGMTSTYLNSTFATRTKAGYRPLSISAAEIGSTVRYTALYEQANVGSYTAKPAIPLGSFGAEFNAELAAQRRLAWADVYTAGGTKFVSAVFHGALTTQYETGFNMTTSMTKSKTSSHLESASYMRGVSSYLDGSTRRHIATWRSAPETTLTSPKMIWSSSTSASFAFTGTDPFATFECRLDVGTWTSCTSPRAYSNLSHGPHLFQVRARDRHGDRDATAADDGWFIDLTPPTVELTRPKAGHVYVFDVERPGSGTTTAVVGNVTVRASAFDVDSIITKVRFKLDGAFVPDRQVHYNASDDSWSFTWKGTTPGRHTLQAVAYNVAGLTSSAPIRHFTYASSLGAR